MAVVDNILAAKAEWLMQLDGERKRLEWELARVNQAIAAFRAIDAPMEAEGNPIFEVPANIKAQEGAFDREVAERAVVGILQGAPHGGMRPKQITEMLRQLGFQVADQFASNVLWKLTNKTKEAQAAGNGRYILAAAETETLLHLPSAEEVQDQQQTPP